MFNVLQWAYDRGLMVQIHPGDLGPVMVVTLATKECEAVKGYIRPDEPGKLEAILSDMKLELDQKKGETNGSQCNGGDAESDDEV